MVTILVFKYICEILCEVGHGPWLAQESSRQKTSSSCSGPTPAMSSSTSDAPVGVSCSSLPSLKRSRKRAVVNRTEPNVVEFSNNTKQQWDDEKNPPSNIIEITLPCNSGVTILNSISICVDLLSGCGWKFNPIFYLYVCQNDTLVFEVLFSTMQMIRKLFLTPFYSSCNQVTVTM